MNGAAIPTNGGANGGIDILDRGGGHHVIESTLWDLLERRVAMTPDHLCMVDERGVRVSFAQLATDAAEVAAGFYELGVRPGHVVAWQ